MACERSDGDGKTGRGKEGKGSGGWVEEREMRRGEWWAITEVAAEQMGPHLGSSHGKWLWMNVRNWGKGSKAGDPWGLMIAFISLFCCLATSRSVVLSFDCTGLVVWDINSKFAYYIRWKQQFGCLWLFVSFILALSFFYLPLIIWVFLSLVLGSVVFCWCFVCIVKWSLPLLVAWKEQMWTGQILSSPASMCRCSWAQHSEELCVGRI